MSRVALDLKRVNQESRIMSRLATEFGADYGG